MDEKIEQLINKWRQMGPAKWAEAFWIMPDGKPIVLRPVQKVFLEYCFEYIQEAVWFLLSCGKKKGKTLTNSIFSLWKMLCYPGEYYCHANSLAQSSLRVYSDIYDMIARDPLLSANCHATQRSITFLPTGSVMRPLAVAGKANAGNNGALLISTETHGVEQGGLEEENWYELLPPPNKIMGVPSQAICDSYSGVLGDSQIWHDLVDHGLEQPVIDEYWNVHFGERVLLMHLTGPEIHEATWHGTPEEWQNWVDDNLRTKSPGKARCHLYNERVSGSFGLSDDVWEDLFDAEHAPMAPNKVTPLVLSYDAARSARGDDFAITAWYKDGPLIKLAFHRVWKGAHRSEELRYEDVFSYSLWLNENYLISEIVYDPYDLSDMMQRLETHGISTKAIKQSKQEMGARGSLFMNACTQRAVVLYHHDDWDHANAGIQLVDQKHHGGVLIKKSGSKKIDLIITMIMALPELTDLSEPLDPVLLAQAHIELTEPSLWHTGANEGWATGRAGYKSRFRNPGRN